MTTVTSKRELNTLLYKYRDVYIGNIKNKIEYLSDL